MNIIKETLPCSSNFKNKEEFVNKIIQQVLVICKEDKSFNTNSKIKKINEYKQVLQEKNNKLNILLDKSKKIKEDMEKQLNEFEESNIKMKQRLLSQLGSEI